MAIQTDGTDVEAGVMQPVGHHRLRIAAIKLLLLGAMGGFDGSGVFHGLTGLYQLSNTVEA